MKKLSTIILFCAFLFSVSMLNAQNILIADNNPTAPSGSHVYSTIQAAIDAAVDDDEKESGKGKEGGEGRERKQED